MIYISNHFKLASGAYNWNPTYHKYKHTKLAQTYTDTHKHTEKVHRHTQTHITNTNTKKRYTDTHKPYTEK